MGNEVKGAKTGGMPLFTPADQISPRWRATELVVAILGAVLVIAAVWMVVRQIGDMYVALAGGRDIIEGKLGRPDDWSFTTAGRVWINQNWGTHLVYYLTWCGLGEWGLLGLKALIMSAAALFMVLAARQRKVDLSVAVVIAATVLAAGRSYIDQRPNLTTLMMAPLLLWLLYRSRDRVHRIWVAAGAVWLWANVHGGFVFGLGMMGLWTVCYLAGEMLRAGAIPALRRLWPLPAATLAALLLSCLVNPFGLTNLTHPMVVAQSQAWKTVSEWCSIFATVHFGTVWEFLTVLAVMSVLALVRMFMEVFSPAGRTRRPSNELLSLAIFQFALSAAVLMLANKCRPGEPHGDELADWLILVSGITAVLSLLAGIHFLARWRRPRAEGDELPLWMGVFEALLMVTACAMAVKSRRFIPLAMIVMAPFLAAQTAWAFHRARKLFLPVAAGGCIVMFVLLASWQLKYYLPNRPGEPPQTVFQRMGRVALSYPVEAADFINANGISGRMFAEWRWEGYLRWRCPQLKNFVGGRAQQVYDEQTYDDGARVRAGVLQPLKVYNVHLVIVPSAHDYLAMRRAMTAPPGKWACVYYDGRNFVYADAASPEGAELVRKVVEGQLIYTDAGTAALSREACLVSPAVGAGPDQIILAIKQAVEVNPIADLYMHYAQITLSKVEPASPDQKPALLEQAVDWLEMERTRLERIEHTPPTVINLLDSRQAVALILSDFYQRLGRGEQAAAARAAAVGFAQDRDDRLRRWNN